MKCVIKKLNKANFIEGMLFGMDIEDECSIDPYFLKEYIEESIGESFTKESLLSLPFADTLIGYAGKMYKIGDDNVFNTSNLLMEENNKVSVFLDDCDFIYFEPEKSDIELHKIDWKLIGLTVTSMIAVYGILSLIGEK